MSKRLSFYVLCSGFLGVVAACSSTDEDFGSGDPDGGIDGSTSRPDSAQIDSAQPGKDTGAGDTGTDATDSGLVDAKLDADADAALASPGLSSVTLPGTGIPVGKTVVVTLVAKDDAGIPVARVGATVVFNTTGGTSVVTIGPVTDKGDGTYVATLTGVTEGTKLAVSAKIDGAPLTTTAAQLRVVNPITTGLTASVDAASADAAGNAGGKNCPVAGLTTWKDGTANAFSGALTGFADVCTGALGSGWAGAGTPADPYRLVFDGVDDIVSFGAVNSITKQTVLAWVRKTGAGTLGITGTGGFGSGVFPSVYPVLAKGTAEAESDALDVNFHLSIAPDGKIGSDYEKTGTSVNAPFLSATAVVDNAWVMMGITLDAAAASRVIWLNGKDDAAAVPDLAPSTGSAALFTIGGAQTSTSMARGRFKGDVAMVLTYDRALTKAEVEANCHAYSARFGMVICPN